MLAGFKLLKQKFKFFNCVVNITNQIYGLCEINWFIGIFKANVDGYFFKSI